MTESNNYGGVTQVILGIIAAIVCAYIVASFLELRSLRRASIGELELLYNRWLEAGQPKGSYLVEFMRGRDPSFVVSNTSVTIDGSNYFTQFAMVKPRSGEAATLFITTNGLCIWWTQSHLPKLVELR